MARLEELNCDVFTGFKLDFLDDKHITAASSLWNKTNFIGFLFYHMDEAHTCGMKNEKVAASVLRI